MIDFRVRMITPRGDGVIIDVSGDGNILHVKLIHTDGSIIYDEHIHAADLAKWINEHQDY